MAAVKDIVSIMDRLADPAGAYPWDNVGLLAGDPEDTVQNVLVTLDVTEDVIREAADKQCRMIVSHHPLIFHAIKTADTTTNEGACLRLLYQNNIALYCAHTSLDVAEGGVNDALCDLLELSDVSLVSPFEASGRTVACARQGKLPKAMQKDELLTFIREKTGAETLLYGGLDNKTFETLALSTGAGEEFAFDHSADVFLTGEIKYHTALELKRKNLPFIAAGHYFTEKPMIRALTNSLQKEIFVLQYPIRVLESTTDTNPFDC